MPIIQPPAFTNSRRLPQIARWAEFKRNWADPWEASKYWVPERARIEVAGGHGSASLSRWLGPVTPEDSATRSLFLPADLVDWYARIRICYPNQNPTTVWTGIVQETNLLIDSPTVGRSQGLPAVGLTWLLDRAEIKTSWVLQNGSPVEVDHLPTFNRRYGSRGLSLRGNRSEEKSEFGCYLFQGGEDGGERWTNRDIVEYYLQTQAPTAIAFDLDGLVDAVDELENEWPQNGTAWSMICQLIDKRHGLVFYPYVSSEDKVVLRVTSMVAQPIVFGGGTLPANPTQIQFTLPVGGVDAHIPLDVSCRFTSLARYDEIIIRGNRVLVMFTLSYADGTLQKGWKADLEAAYRSGGGGADEKAQDAYRTQFRFEDVWRLHVVPRAWNGHVRDGVGEGQGRPVAPTANDDGTLDFEQLGPFWRDYKLFESQLPIEKGKRYDVDPIVDETPTGEEREFRPILAAINDVYDGAQHKAANRFIRLDRLGYNQSGLKNCTPQTSDRALGIRLNADPGHYFAGAAWDASNKTEILPELDYTNLLATVAMTTDVRPNIRIPLGANATENEKVKIIDVEADFWYAVPLTVVDVDADGNLVRIADENLAILDEREKLEAHAAYAQAWYSVERQAVSIPLQTLGVFVELGSYLTGISNVYMWLPVNTVVTAVEWDFPGDGTRIETGFGSDDLLLEPAFFTGQRRSKSRAGR